MKRLVLIWFWLVPLFGLGQNFEWVNAFGGGGRDKGNDLIIDNDGNLWVVGFFSDTTDFDMGPDSYQLISHGGSDAFVAKYSPDGELIWVKQFGSIHDYDEANYLTLTPDGNMLITGRFFGPLDFDPGPDVYSLEGDEAIFILKLDYDGNFIWVKHYENFEGNSYPKGTQCDANGNIYVVGDFAGPVDFDPSLTDTFTILSYECWRAFITKMTPNGDFMWAKYFGGYSPWQNTHIADMEMDGSGNIILTGVADAVIDLDPGSDTLEISGGTFISKFDVNGNLSWGHKLTSIWIQALETDSLNNIYTTGRFNSNNVDFDPGPVQYLLSAGSSHDGYLAKYSPDMGAIWVSQFEANVQYGNTGVNLRLNGSQQSVVVAGQFKGTTDFNPAPPSFAYNAQIARSHYLCSMDTTGNFNWVKHFQALFSDQYSDFYLDPMAICFDVEDNVYSTGLFRHTADFDPGNGTAVHGISGSYDAFIHKLSACTASTYGSAADTLCYFTAPGNDVPWSQSGVYQYAIPNAAGCDSIITLNLTTFNNTGSTNVTACDHYVSPSGNYVWTNSTTYRDTITNSLGCDSVLTIHLTILPNSDSAFSKVACKHYTAPSGDHTWTTSGQYIDVLESENGCDSILLIDLTIVNVDVSVSVNVSNQSLSSNLKGATYQWFDCSDGFIPIEGQGDQGFTPTESGQYAVVVSADGCTDTSSCYGMFGIGIEEVLAENGIGLYPNPVSDKLHITLPSLNKGLEVTVFDATGRKVLEQPFAPTLDLSVLASGAYTVRIETQEGIHTQHIVKK